MAADIRSNRLATEGLKLDRIQRWMQAVITHPAGVVGGVESDAAQQEIAIGPPDLEQVLTRSRALPAADRLAVYANAYFARLLECLREEYPALGHALGAELFDEFAVGYLAAYPSSSYTLAHLGAAFPRYLAETCPPEDDSGWTAFVVDVAILERMYSEVFDDPGSERREHLSVDHLRTIPADQWADARLVPAVDVRLITLRSPVHEYMRGVRKEEHPPIPEPSETLLVVHRRDYVVRRHALNRPQFELLGAIIEAKTVGDAIAQAAEFVAEDTDAFGEDLRTWFRDWAAEGLFESVELRP